MKKQSLVKKGDFLNGIKVLRVQDSSNGKPRMVDFECRCGKKFTTRLSSVKNLHTKSCGCYKHGAITHGDSQYYYLYKVWESVKQRCFNKNASGYKYYGGRGIAIYEPWIKDYAAFKEWILGNIGERPDGHSLDRINNNGNYEPDNLRWATAKEQALNRGKIKLSDKDVLDIRLMIERGLSQTKIGGFFGVTQSTIWRIKNNKIHINCK